MATREELRRALNGSEHHKQRVEAKLTQAEVAQEREPEVQYRTPDIVWQGYWKQVADALGIYDWRVWIAVTAALSARAHRNIFTNYHGYLYGMGAWLLIAPSGVGKRLVTDVCNLLLPRDYPNFDSVESGQALAESLATITREPKTGNILNIASYPSILVTSEWSQLIKAVDFNGSSLLERLHKAVDGEKFLNLNRADKKGNGKLRIPNPTLTLLGTTTNEVYCDIIKEKHTNSGFINRHFILPTEAKRWLYDAPNDVINYDGVEAIGFAMPEGRTFGIGHSMRSMYEDDAYKRDIAFGEKFLEPFRNEETPKRERDLFGRLHAYHRRIACIYAWAEGAEKIRLPHVLAAEAAVRTSHQFLMELHGGQLVELPTFMKARGEVEEKILDWIRRNGDVTKRDVCEALRRNGGFTAISEAIGRLQHEGALTVEAGGGRGKKALIRLNVQ